MIATTLGPAGFDLVTATDLRCCEAVGYRGLARGLAAALGLPTGGLAGGDETAAQDATGTTVATGPAGELGPVSVTEGGWAAVPADLLPHVGSWIVGDRRLAADDVLVVRYPHSLADAEGIALVRVADTRQEPDIDATVEAALRPDQSRVDLHVALRFAAVRLGLTRNLLDQAARHLAERLSGDIPLLRLQLPQATIADCAAGIELTRESLAILATADPGSVRDLDPDRSVLADVHARISALDWQVITLFGASGYVADHPVRRLYISELLRNLLVPAPPAGAGDDDRADRGR